MSLVYFDIVKMIKKTRAITKKERLKARKTYWLILLILPFSFLLIWTMFGIDKIPFPARIFGFVVATAIPLVYLYGQYILEKELREGLLEEIEGVIKNKTKLGTSTSNSSNTPTNTVGNNYLRSKSYIFTIDEQSFWVKAKYYHQVKVGDKIKMLYLPKSQIILTLEFVTL